MKNTANAFKFYDYNPETADLYREVMAGLSRRPRSIAPKFFYNQAGSEIFDAICRTPEYYPTRTELDIIRQNIDEIAAYIGVGCLLVEPGSGASLKVRELLDALKPHAYLPMDISGAYLKKAAQSVARDYPWLDVHAVCVDYTAPIDLPYRPKGPHRVAFFPGSSIGNFEPADAVEFLANIAGLVQHDGGLLIGVDLKKRQGVLNAAYNDAEGVTAAFNYNLLTRINTELGADFDIGNFRHHAFYNEHGGRIEMHLVSKARQQVTIAGQCFDFEEGESIHTENSYKYTVEEFQALAGQAGFSPVKVWTDRDGLFSLHYFVCE